MIYVREPKCKPFIYYIPTFCILELYWKNWRYTDGNIQKPFQILSFSWGEKFSKFMKFITSEIIFFYDSTLIAALRKVFDWYNLLILLIFSPSCFCNFFVVGYFSSYSPVCYRKGIRGLKFPFWTNLPIHFTLSCLIVIPVWSKKDQILSTHPCY